MENIFADFEVISTYTRKEAIEDGTLVDVSANFPDLCRRYYKYPIAVTGAVWQIIQKAVNCTRYANDYRGVIADILWMSQKAISQRIDESQHLFSVIITGTGRRKHHTFKIICHPGDDGEACLTIMLPNED